MANVAWRGGAPTVAKVITLTIGGTIEVGDLFVVTIGSKSFSYAAASTVAATVATGFAAAWNALSPTNYPEFMGTARGYTALATSGGALTLTAKTAGFNGTVSITTTESNGSAADDQTFIQAVTTAASGPNDWSVALNWVGGAVPVNSDVVYIENSAHSIYYGLDQSAVTVAGLYIAKNFTGTIGLPKDYSPSIPEYLETYLKIGATICQIGYGDGDGSGRIKINFGSVQTACTVLGSGDAEEEGLESVLLLGTHASNVVTSDDGDVGIAVFGGETSTVLTLRSVDANTRCGPGVTLTTVQHAGSGLLQISSACTTINKEVGSAEMRVFGSGAITTANARGGTFSHGSSGTITTLNVAGGALADFDFIPVARTVTNCNAASGSTIRDRAKTVTWSNGIIAQNCEIADLNLDLGSNRTVTVT